MRVMDTDRSNEILYRDFGSRLTFYNQPLKKIKTESNDCII